MVLKPRLSKKDLRRKKVVAFVCLLAAACFMALGLTLVFWDVIQMIINYRLRIRPGSAVMDFMSSEIKTVYNQVYLFNVTNGARFLSGVDQKLRVSEVGPFTYKETRKNENLELDEAGGVMRYSILTTPTFVPERSIGRPEDFIVTMPNLPMLGVSSLMSSYSYFPRLSFSLLSQQLRSRPLVTIDAQSYLWGYPEPILKLANKILPGIINFDSLGLLEKFYDQSLNYAMEVSAEDADKFQIKKRNGFDKLLMNEQQKPEDCKYCDTFEDAYEGLMFPTSVTPEFKIRLFKTGLCKILDMEYHQTKRLSSYDAMVFRLSEKFFSLNKSSVNDGLLDLSECYYGLPVSLSKLYFLDMNPDIYNRIEGLRKPDPKHHTYVMVDPKMGLTLDTYVPIQVNLVTRDLSYHSQAKPFSNMVIPICYVIFKQLDLNSNTLRSLEVTYRTAPLLLTIFKFITFAASVILIAYSAKTWRIVKNERSKSLRNVAYPVLPTGSTVEKILPLLDQYTPERSRCVHLQCKLNPDLY